jgi:hypothetical protein
MLDFIYLGKPNIKNANLLLPLKFWNFLFFIYFQLSKWVNLILWWSSLSIFLDWTSTIKRKHIIHAVVVSFCYSLRCDLSAAVKDNLIHRTLSILKLAVVSFYGSTLKSIVILKERFSSTYSLFSMYVSTVLNRLIL